MQPKHLFTASILIVSGACSGGSGATSDSSPDTTTASDTKIIADSSPLEVATDSTTVTYQDSTVTETAADTSVLDSQTADTAVATDTAVAADTSVPADTQASEDGGAASAGQSAGCGTTPSIASSQYNNGTLISITAAGMQRRYILNVPTNYVNTKPYKLVIAYHQRDGNDKQMYANGYYHLLTLSNNSTIFVAPNGQQNGAPCTGTGNGDTGCGWPNPNDSDMELADAIVAQIEKNFCVDTNRIFATGWSYGASMSYETACERPLNGESASVGWGVRAIAVYSAAQLSGSCQPTKPVAYYASHGTGDAVLCYDSASTNCSFPTPGGVGLCNNYATVDGCTWTTPTKVTSGNHVCTDMTGCAAGYPVEFCSFNGPHTPDPTDPGQYTSWEYQNVWTFLSQF